jgi:1-acyl-sn-glycerol-3-phosphate acyltransferase
MNKNFPKLPPLAPQRGSRISRGFFKQLYLKQGWSFEGEFPNLPKAVAIVSPHTSNYDGLYAFLAMLGLGINVTVFGKDSLFKSPLKYLLKWVGVIPVKRDTPQGLTQQIVDVVNNSEKIWVGMAPEGTRKNAEKIRSGFYHIAMGANIPVVMFAFDYQHKTLRCLGMLKMTGNYESDITKILEYYRGNISAKYPERLARPFKTLL